MSRPARVGLQLPQLGGEAYHLQQLIYAHTRLGGNGTDNRLAASMSDIIDFDTAAIIAEELGCKVEKEIIVTIEEKLIIGMFAALAWLMDSTV